MGGLNKWGIQTAENWGILDRRLQDVRCNRKSTMLTTNLGYEEWGKFLGNDSLVAALISRLGQKSRTFAFPKDAVNLRNPKLGLPATAPRPTILDAA